MCVYIYMWSPSENWRRKTTHWPHHISTPPSSISFLNLFQAPSRPFQLPEVSSQQQEWIGRSCPKMLFRSFPARRSLPKNLASANVMSLQVTLGGNPMDMMDFLWVEMHQPSHLKGKREIPMSYNNDDKRIANYKSFSATALAQIMLNFNMFNPQTSEELLWTKCGWGRAPGANAGSVPISSIQSRHPNTKLAICTTRDQQVPVGMDSYLGDGTGTLDFTRKTSWDGHTSVVDGMFDWYGVLGMHKRKGLHFEAPSLVESGNSKGKDIRTEKHIIICTMAKQKHCDNELHSQLFFFSTNQPGGAPTTMITMWHLRPSYFAIRRPTKQP